MTSRPEQRSKGSQKYRRSHSRGFDRLRRVYEELSAFLGDAYSPAELLKAAQALIDVNDSEYSAKRYQDAALHPGYYSYAVDSMIIGQAWWLLENELGSDNLSDERLAGDWNAQQRLKKFYNPDSYYHRG